jgi:hypothetical protein
LLPPDAHFTLERLTKHAERCEVHEADAIGSRGGKPAWATWAITVGAGEKWFACDAHRDWLIGDVAYQVAYQAEDNATGA